MVASGIDDQNKETAKRMMKARALLGDYTDKEDTSIRIGVIMGLGIAYAGSQSEQLPEKLIGVLNDSKASLDVLAFNAISLGLIFEGSCNEEIAQEIIYTLMDRSESELGEPLTRLLPLGLDLLYLGKQDSVDATAEVSKTFNEKIRKYCDMTLVMCLCWNSKCSQGPESLRSLFATS
ncbi:26S proteasome non-ATPase regulatory subunit 2 homolog A-like [Vigna umbellata]|uniref:26S proteasome non-ATPase regulatory subunit 2 homolog A-like n=1 Tax=Vigna umbellata TaxID=87088 RepID=UPI001F5F1571|nr:26S proteasome non-ATPase regulatory subunit 2 homolog A-like [Vigna umbellata]XP_047154496.1 26S proteasome non-ATPase regulatory subunit 2 homolog A-like [Vigna umbellata]